MATFQPEKSIIDEAALPNGFYLGGEALNPLSIAPAPLPIAPEQSMAREIEKSPKFTLRMARQDDIDAIVDVDIRSFDGVYSSYDQGEDELRADLRQKFSRRLEMVGSDWMPVLERDGEIVGFMTCCPTNKTPEEFESWEQTTNNGTLEGTYDPDGKNIYVVTLSVLPEGSPAKDMLYADQIGKMLQKGYNLAFFESRLPGLKAWMKESKGLSTDEKLASLSEEDKRRFADEYFSLKTEVRSKEVRQDRLIRLYERIGCACLRVVPDAYKDDESLNFGVVCVYDGAKLFDGSDLPVKLPQNRTTRWIFGTILQKVAHSPKLTRKIFS